MLQKFMSFANYKNKESIDIKSKQTSTKNIQLKKKLQLFYNSLINSIN